MQLTKKRQCPLWNKTSCQVTASYFDLKHMQGQQSEENTFFTFDYCGKYGIIKFFYKLLMQNIIIHFSAV